MTTSTLNLRNPSKQTNRLWFAAAIAATALIVGVVAPLEVRAATTKKTVLIGVPFRLSASESTVDVVSGEISVVTISSSRTKGFTSPIYLAASGMPRGVTVKALRNPLTTSKTSTEFTITVGLAATFRSATITVSGSSKGRTSRAVLRLVLAPSTPGAPSTTLPPVTPSTPTTTIAPVTSVAPTIAATTTTSPASTTTTTAPISDYTLSVEPTSVNVAAGGSVTAVLRVARLGGFNQDLLASVENTPIGLSGTVDPIGKTDNTSTIRITATSTVVLGSYDVLVRARGRSTTLRVNVGNLASSVFVALPATLSIARGGSGLTSLSLTRAVGTSAISWSVDNLPAGVNASYSVNGGTAVATQATFTAATTATLGTFILTLRASLDGGSVTLPFTLVVADAAVAAAVISPSTLTIALGGSGAVTITPGALPAGNPAFIVTGFPSGTVASIVQNATQYTYSFTVPAATPAGTYVVNFSVSQGGGTSSGIFTLIVGTPSASTTSTTLGPTSAFTISTVQPTLSIARGATGVITVPVTWTLGVVPQPIQFETTGGPAGMTVTYTANPSSQGTTVNLIVPAAAATGTYIISVRGTVAALGSSTATVTLTVT